MFSSSTLRGAWLLITVCWLVSRAYPLMQAVPDTYWEVWEARKLLEYGFVERQGAIINIHFMAGQVAAPEQFNYVNNPYGILWLDTFFHWIGGPWGPLVANALMGLATYLAGFHALRHWFPHRASLLAAVLYTLAPTAIIYDVDPGIVAAGAMSWPWLVWLASSYQKNPRIRTLALLALATFISGQFSWFAYTIWPALLAGFWCWHRRPDWRLMGALALGGALTLATHALQIWYYTWDWQAFGGYVQAQAGVEGSLSRLQMARTIGIRTLISVGPALLAGAALGLWTFRRRQSWLRWSAVIYLGIFVLAAAVLTRFFYRENTMYSYLLFPASALLAGALTHYPGRRISTALLALAVAGVGYPWLQASIPRISNVSRTLGAYLHEVSRPTDVVATNMRDCVFPFEAWDVGSTHYLKLEADRLLFANITTLGALEALRGRFYGTNHAGLFLRVTARPLDGELAAWLEANATATETRTITVPPQPPTPALRLRELYWKLSYSRMLLAREGAGPERAAGEPVQVEIRLYRLKPPAPGPAGTAAP